MEVCIGIGNGYYLLGNIDLSDAKSACTDLQNSGPRWIGVIKENFVKSDQGNTTEKDVISNVVHGLLF